MGYAQSMDLILSSLVGEESATYYWPYVFKEQGYEIIDTISLVCHETAELRHSLDYILNDYDIYNYENMRMVCSRYNKVIGDFRKSHIGCFSQTTWGRPSTHLLRHILQQCYNRAVDDPELLNQYEPFSAEVYGETSFELVDQMIKTIKFSENDKFIDLGSGVGQVVMQVAAATHCKSCYGIEKAFWPAKYAKEMSIEFQKWLKFFGKTCGDFNIIKGNFLDDDHKDIISSATVIFVNNFAFGPQVDYELKQRFSNLKEGTKIVSSKAFCALNMQISERNLSDIGAILTVEELSPLRGPVSWTPKQVTYYLHTVDRSLLEEYFRRRQKPFYKGSQALARSRKERNQAGGETSGSDTQQKLDQPTRRNHRKKSIHRPTTLSMVSTITASISPRFYPSTIKVPSKSSDTGYHYPSAQALLFEGHPLVNDTKSGLLKTRSKNNNISTDCEFRPLDKMGKERKERTSQWLFGIDLTSNNCDAIHLSNANNKCSTINKNTNLQDKNIFDICSSSDVSKKEKDFNSDLNILENIRRNTSPQRSSVEHNNLYRMNNLTKKKKVPTATLR